MSITLEQLQDRYQARNVAQWEWRVIDRECPQIGNHAVLNLRFGRVIKTTNNHTLFTKGRSRALFRQFKAIGPTCQKIRRARLMSGRKRCHSPMNREVSSKLRERRGV